MYLSIGKRDDGGRLINKVNVNQAKFQYQTSTRSSRFAPIKENISTCIAMCEKNNIKREARSNPNWKINQ